MGDSDSALVKDFQSVSNNFKPKNYKRKEKFGKVSKNLQTRLHINIYKHSVKDDNSDMSC